MSIPQYYIDLLTQMPVNKNKSKTAPHKAILLLTIIDMIENEQIITPFIQISESLQSNFHRVWKANVQSRSSYRSKIAYPFFHLSSSPFWHLIKTNSYKGQDEYSSIKALERDFSGAIIDNDLFLLMKDPITREEIRSLLKSTFIHRGGNTTCITEIASIIALIFSVA